MIMLQIHHLHINRSAHSQHFFGADDVERALRETLKLLIHYLNSVNQLSVGVGTRKNLPSVSRPELALINFLLLMVRPLQ